MALALRLRCGDHYLWDVALRQDFLPRGLLPFWDFLFDATVCIASILVNVGMEVEVISFVPFGHFVCDMTWRLKSFRLLIPQT